MDVKEAVAAAKSYVSDVFAEEAQLSNLGLEETEFDRASGKWLITVSFSRPWNTPRSRSQEILESIQGAPALKRSYKVVTIADDGSVIAMKDRARSEAAE